jgi:hypothetical protein
LEADVTIIHTDLPEERLLEALRESMAPRSDAGMTVKELSMHLFGKVGTNRIVQTSAILRALMAEGKVVRGFRSIERIDGQRHRVAVFAVVE